MCGAAFSRNRGARDAKKFCSRACAYAMRRVKTAIIRVERAASRVATNPLVLLCVECGQPRTGHARSLVCSVECRRRRVASQARDAYYRTHPIPVDTHPSCLACGVPMVRGRSQRGRRRSYCSKRCHRKANKRHPSRARKHGGAVEKGVTTLQVANRYGWQCALCGCATPRRLLGQSDDQSPTLDHIVPLAKGGGHTWVNVQVACRRCNTQKRDTVLGQPRLIA
jgi:5-methylcytosine-specific restriction endonuclease McrA